MENKDLSTLTPQELFERGCGYFFGDGIEQDYAQALEFFQLSAEKGHAAALNSLGYMYLDGIGVEKDYAKALEYYKLAVEKGNADSLLSLGYMYERGFGVEQDYAKVIEYYNLAAEKGQAAAQNNLGYMYMEGRIVEQDDSKAAEFFQLAADQGFAKSQKALGYMYHTGRGVEQNFTKAAEYYKLAADQGDEDAQGCLDELLAEMNGQSAVHKPMDFKSLDEQYVSERELQLVYEAVETYNARALDGAVPEICRVVTYKMAKTLAMRLEYPAEADKAFDLVLDQAGWLARNASALDRDDRVSLVSFYLERLVFNLGGDMNKLVQTDPRYATVFGTHELLEKFVDDNPPAAGGN